LTPAAAAELAIHSRQASLATLVRTHRDRR
jgi:hypothetical protein